MPEDTLSGKLDIPELLFSWAALAGDIAQMLGARFLRVEEERTGHQVKGTCLMGPGGEV